MKHVLISFALVLGMINGPANAVSINLTSGVTGSIYGNQSFHGETRAATVTVLGANNLAVSSMTLNLFDIKPGTTTMGARIYDTTTQLILAFANITPTVGDDQSVTIPITATLIAGQSYTLGFFVGAPTVSINSGDMFAFSTTPYTETNGYFQITGATSIAGDVFPNLSNIFIPVNMGLEVSAVPVPGAVWLFGSALGVMGWMRRKAAS